MPSPQALIEKIQTLPPERLGEVEDFVDFLNAKSRRLAALDRLLAVAPALEAAGAPEMSEEEIQAEVDAARARPAGAGQTCGSLKRHSSPPHFADKYSPFALWCRPFLGR